MNQESECFKYFEFMNVQSEFKKNLNSRTIIPVKQGSGAGHIMQGSGSRDI